MRIVVVGAGIAGLAAAHALRDAGAAVTVVDGARKIGGKLRTSEVAGIAVDEGAEAFILRAPEGRALAEQVGLRDCLSSPATSSAGLLVAGTVRPLPSGTLLGIPTDPEPIRRTFGDAVAHTVVEEPTRSGEPVTEDISVGELVRRRLGRVVADGLVDPLLGGVYAGHADQLSLRATMPAIATNLAEDPSLVRAARLALAGEPSSAGTPSGAGRRTRAESAVADRSVPAARPVFCTVTGGLGDLAEAVLGASGAALRLRTPVREIRRHGVGFQVEAGPVPDPTVLDADGVVVAVPASKAAAMLRQVVPWAAGELAQIRYASLAIVTLVYPRTSLPPGSGLLVPGRERRTGAAGDKHPEGGFSIKALTYSSRKWTHLDDGRHAVVRASIGRYGEEHVLHRDDAELVAAAVRDVADLTGVAVDPVASRVTRWGGALPQYAVGHVDRVRRILQDVARVPGLAVCGAAYEGVGIPACIRSGQAAAAAVMADLSTVSGPRGGRLSADPVGERQTGAVGKGESNLWTVRRGES